MLTIRVSGTCLKTARRLLGWQPEFAGREGLRRGLKITVDWFSDPANQAHYRTDRYMI